MRAPSASRSSNVCPDVDTHTGSMAIGTCRRSGALLRQASNVRATARTTPAFESIPILIAAMAMSSRTDRSCVWIRWYEVRERAFERIRT